MLHGNGHATGGGGTSKAKGSSGGSNSLINNRPGTAPKRPASPGA